MAEDDTDAMSIRQSDHEWRWSRQGVEQRIRAMSPADALVSIELFNARQANDVSKHLDAGACLSCLSPREAHEIRERVAALRQSAMRRGQEYWVERLREERTGIKDSGHDEMIMTRMAAAHPGFAVETLQSVYLVGLMLAR
jgi:hypothetical protein